MTMEERLALWLRKHYPRDVLMPIERGSKRPAFSHRNDTWSWYRYLTKRKNEDLGILLVQLCVVDVDCHSVADALEERFEILRVVPCEDTTKGRHYYFSRSKKADVEGYYDSSRQRNAKIDFKSICSNGTSGIVAVSPSTGKTWKKERAPWMCYPDGHIPEIPDDLLEHVGRARHTPISCSLQFLLDGEIRDIVSCNLMAGSAYLDIFVRDPLESCQSDTMVKVPIPNFRANTFDDMLHVCATGELHLTQTEILDLTPADFKLRIETICALADFLGMPAKYDGLFRAPYGYLWSCVRLHDLSRHLSAVTVVEGYWRFLLGCHIGNQPEWRKTLVEIDSRLAEKIRYRPIETSCDSFLFHERPSMAGSMEFGSHTIRSNPADIELPWIIDTILHAGRGRIMLAGGSVLGEVAIDCSQGADYDFFLFGIDAERASTILEDITGLTSVSEIHRSEHAITFKKDEFIFQVITRLFRNPAEILHGFDISACKIGFYIDEDDCKHLLATPSWVESMRYRVVWMDDRVWSRSSAVRLCKYYCKGFDVLIPGLVRSALDKSVDLRRDLSTFDGVSLFFAMEYQLHNRYGSKHDVRSRVSSKWLDTLLLTKMKGHQISDYTTLMKTTRLLHYLFGWLTARNATRLDTQKVLVWSVPEIGRAICGTFAQTPANHKDILLF